MISKSLIAEYLRFIVLIMNEVIDFYVHNVVLYDIDKNSFTISWHLIEGGEVIDDSVSRIEIEKILSDIMDKRKPQIGLPNCFDKKEQIGRNSMVVPLFIGDVPVGVLAITPPDEQNFDSYDAFLAQCVVDVVSNHYDKSDEDVLASLQFSILHRRGFLSASPDLPEVLHEFLRRIISYQEFPLLSKNVKAFGNIRLIGSNPENRKTSYLYFAKTLGIDDNTRELALKHTVNLSTKSIQQWMECIASNNKHYNIDPSYSNIFPDAISHIEAPCWFKGKLYGILSIDSSLNTAFNTKTMQVIYIIAAQAAPVIANAIKRSQLVKEQNYLISVINAIPDELLIINEDARIIAMNKSKTERFPEAELGQYCFEAFEYGRKEKCAGCYTLRTIDSGISFKQAMWEYTDSGTRKKRYVEISSGLIESPLGTKREAVEIVRDVSAQESLLQWMANTNKLLWDKSHEITANNGIPAWLVDHIAKGFQDMGIPRYRIYSYRNNQFQGDICMPAKCFKGKNFREFVLDPNEDLPSQLMCGDENMRPIRFEVNPSKCDGKEYLIPDKMEAWNYLTCYLSELPIKCNRFLNKDETCGWVDVPFVINDELTKKPSVYGKASVDWGNNKKISHMESETAHEMALLSAFGRFASLAIYAAHNHSALLRAKRDKTNLLDSFAHDAGSPTSELDYTIQNLLITSPMKAISECDRLQLLSKHLSALVGTYLMIGGQTATKINRRNVNLYKAVNDAYVIACTPFKEKSMEIIFKNMLPTEECEYCDASKLHIILVNLLKNAIPYSDKLIQVEIDRSCSSNCIRITDDGIGYKHDFTTIESMPDKHVGLWIANWFAVKHGWGLKVIKGSNGGTVALIKFTNNK